MAEKTITTQIKIDGAITPDFSYDWEIEFKGEKYIHPLRKPQATKENTSLNSAVDLTFQHWAVYQLKRWMFFTVQPVESGTAVADKYIASVSLNLGDFCILFGQVLQYYFGDKITIDLNTQWEYSSEPTVVEVSYSYLWDVLIKLYELYAVRWSVEPASDNSNTAQGGEKYVIKVGYPADEMSHIFEYGFKGGLLKVERQVQDENIRNMLLGRGGEKNLPYRYFKDVDPQNPNFPADPDWVPELRNIYFDRLRGKTFRDYIKGWKTNPHRQLTEADGTPIKPYGSNIPIAVETFDTEYASANFAYMLGHTDTKFNPVEYVADKLVVVDLQVVPEAGSSIAHYGELLGGLEDNEEIYPTIQGVTVNPYGRIDEAVAVEPIESDDVVTAVENDAQMRTEATLTAEKTLGGKARGTVSVMGKAFTVEAGKYADYDEGAKNIRLTKDQRTHKLVTDNRRWTVKIDTVKVAVDDISQVLIEDAVVTVVDVETGVERSASGIPSGRYYPKISFKLYNESDITLNISVECSEPKLISATPGSKWTSTWDVWVKNIWNTTKRTGESDIQYANRVWKPILGDHLGNEAKIVFADGMLSTSEDYEFVITSIPKYEKKTCSWETMENGQTVVHEYESEWRLTLAKSDADYDTLGIYVPSTMRQAKAGDHFFFVGIDMPHQYVLWAEERLDGYKTDQMKEVSDIKPTWVVTLDKIRAANLQENETDTLLSSLKPGNSLRLADKRFIINSEGSSAAYETLYLQSVTYTYNEPSSESAALIPDVEVVLSDKYETTASPVATLSGEVRAIAKQLGSISNVEQIVRAVGDKLYLRKDGLADRSMSPTEFASLLTSQGFRSGIAGGAGWGFFKDENGNWVLETDRINVRQEMEVNNLVINQISARGGMIIESAASMEITHVAETAEGYVCYFDQREGSLANLFHEDDVAYCSRLTPENAELKFYKRRVIAIDEDSVTLSKTEANGDGVPSEGDVIVHYGNYTDANRRYVKVRDVIGGGYERYIEGLDSVSSAGEEYYFVGRQAGMYNGKPRWFVGGADSYIEYKDGLFSLNNVSLSVNSTVGDKSIEMYVADKLGFGVTNIVIDSERELPVLTVATTEAVYLLSEGIVKGETYTASFWGDPGTFTGSLRLGLYSGDHSVQFVQLKKQKHGLWRATFEAVENADNIKYSKSGSSELKALKVKIERGMVGTDWSPAPDDSDKAMESMDYLKRALKESTLIDGGLVVASLLQLGYTTDENGYVIQSGVNGIYDGTKPGGGIAFWAGGDMKDAADETAEGSAATHVVRMDGTGYMANNTIRFDHNRLMLGDSLVVSDNELRMETDDGIALVIKDGKTGFSTSSNLTTAVSKIEYSLTSGITNVFYSPTSQSNYVSTMIETKEVSLGQILANTQISIKTTLRCRIYFGGGPGLVVPADNSGLLYASIVNNTSGNESMTIGRGSWRETGRASGYVYYKVELSGSAVVPEDGEYALKIQSVDPLSKIYGEGSEVPAEDPVEFEVEVTFNGSLLRRFIIGSDGFTANWNNSLMCVDDNGALLRFGQSYIRLCEGGVKINRNDGKGEVDL